MELEIRETRDFTRVKPAVSVPPLALIQLQSYKEFLQSDAAPEKREPKGLEAVFRETFPIRGGGLKLAYRAYELGKPRYTPEECRRLRLTYAAPLKVRLVLDEDEQTRDKERQKPVEATEEEVYLGEIPIMIGGGEFIINGAERVVVSQLHRSPGIDFRAETEPGGRKLHSCRIVPERGSWVEFTTSKREVLYLRIDQSGRIPATCLLRALLPEERSNPYEIIRLFYPTEKVEQGAGFAKKIAHKRAAAPIPNPTTGEILVDSGEEIKEDIIPLLQTAGVKEVEIITDASDVLILETLKEDAVQAKGRPLTRDEALLRFYRRLRPGNPESIEKAEELMKERFDSSLSRYFLGRVGRFRLNRKLGLESEDMSLTYADIIESIRYLLKLRKGEGTIDDIDHLGNRRIRTVGELACDEIRKGLLRLKRSIHERLSLSRDEDTITPRTIVNSRVVSAAIESFFSRGELSQVVDQVNPLAQLTNERRFSAMGPGGLNRKRAGFEVRDVHPSHYGRICPIETPEGTNIGLILSEAIYATVDEYGFLKTPYRRVRKGVVTDETVELRADEEDEYRIAPADVPLDKHSRIIGPSVLARHRGDYVEVSPEEIDFLDVSPTQMVGLSASLIPFLEHDDANRALMGSNMQRQAVPLLVTEPPLVATGMEQVVAQNSSMVVVAEHAGRVDYVDATKIVVADRTYTLRKFAGLNSKTSLNQRPIVKEGDKVKKGQVIADGAATYRGELSLGKNVLVAFMPWEGYNFEDAIIVSESLLARDTYTSVHIEEFEVEVRETKLGREEFTRDIPGASEKMLRNLDENGVVRVGSVVRPGDILVGKISPKPKTELSPEEKLLNAIFGRMGEDVRNESLTVPAGIEGIVIHTDRFSRRSQISEDERKREREDLKRIEKDIDKKIADVFRAMILEIEGLLGTKVHLVSEGRTLSNLADLSPREILDIEEIFDPEDIRAPGAKKDAIREICDEYYSKIDALKDDRERQILNLRIGDELPTGVLEMVKVYVAMKRVLSVGDKMAGRHGNKGVVAKILPVEDMPYLADGTPIDMILNPMGVPSRMNIGQLFEAHMGWAAGTLGYRCITPVFNGATEQNVRAALKEAGLPEDGKVTLYDGRTGEPFDQKVTVGHSYIMKLEHLVTDKVHARATGPYSLITQQPLGGKARFGGQRLGEMEGWALEAYGAAYTLQEMFTVKSDDVDGRTRMYEAIVKGQNVLEAGVPASFDVLVNEIKGLGLNVRFEKARPKELS